MNNKLLCLITAFILTIFLNIYVCAAPSISEAADSAFETDTFAGLSEDGTEPEDSSTSRTGSTAEYFGAGLGIKDYPYIISTGEELSLLSKVVNEKKEGFYDACYILGADIDLGGKVWTPIGLSNTSPFMGTFDGNGHKIENFCLSGSEYTGLFGYILNGTVKNLSVENFEISLTFDTAPSYSSVYAGALAGYIASTNGESNICGVCVTNGSVSFSGSADNLYAGSITGYAYSYSTGKVNIFDCYANSNISATNSTGFNYIGGLAGYLCTGSTSLTSIVHCYCTGSVSSTSDHTSRAGGLVGYLFSHGSAYAQTGSASLLAADKDIMLIDSYSVTNVYSLSTNFTSRAGYLVGECNTYAGTKNVFYANSGITITADKTDSTGNVINESTGTATALSNLKSSSYLSNSRGFDFVNVWGSSAEINDGYPYLLSVKANKPEIKLADINLGAKISEDNVRYFEIDGFQYPLYERADNLIRIAPKKDLLIEIVEKDSADSLFAVSTKYYFVDFETMSCREISKLASFMGNNNHAVIRTKKPVSIRFASQISTTAKKEETEFVIKEYGFIVGVKSLIESTDSQLNFDFVNYATGVSYNKETGLDLVFDSSDDDLCIFTGILVDIPTANYNTYVTSKNYTKISVDGNDFIIYGEPVSASLYDIAKEQMASLDENDPGIEVLKKIIDAVDGE